MLSNTRKKNDIRRGKLYSKTVFAKCSQKSHLSNHTGNLQENILD